MARQLKIKARDELIRFASDDMHLEFSKLNDKQRSIAVARFYIKEKQVSFLRAEGCTELQGYYFSKPLPFVEASALFGSAQREQTRVA